MFVAIPSTASVSQTQTLIPLLTGLIKPIGVGIDRMQATTHELETIASAINQRGKHPGRPIRNATTGRVLFATTAAANGTWADANGTVVHTPV